MSRQGDSSADRSPRFAFNQSLVLKDGVLFQSRENESKPIGPGYYAVPIEGTLLRPSFNVRCAPSTPSPARATSPHYSSGSRASPGGSARPRSASSGPRLTPKRA